MAVDWAALERAAEQTIAAAAAAVLWAGEDNHGVLAHVAAATAAKMAESRVGYAMVHASPPEGWDEEMTRGLLSAFEEAALPADAVPAWTASVSAAMEEALQDRDSSTCIDDHGRRTQHADPATSLRAAHGLVRFQALWMCSMWGQEPLPFNLIEHGSHVMSYTALPPVLLRQD